MNVERLHLVARAISVELAELDLVAAVERLRSGLQNLASSPTDAAAAQTISQARTELLSKLPGAPSNSWPSTDRQILDEIGISEELGASLLERIEAVLTRNEMTPSVALEEIGPIYDRLAGIAQHLTELLTAFEFFGISQDVLVDDYEVGVAIPRGAVNNKLPLLGAEFVELQKILGPFEELAGENQPDFEVRAIASTDFSVYLAAAPTAAFFIVKAINAIEDVYIKWLDIKRLRTELAEKEIPEEDLSGLDERINAMVDQRLVELAHELVEESALPDEHRSNELENGVKWALRRLAERVDQGYSVDVRTPEPPPEEPEDEEGAEEDEGLSDRARLLAIRELAANIRRLDPQGKRILQLPRGDEPPNVVEDEVEE
jgi:hypothetical protein